MSEVNGPHDCVTTSKPNPERFSNSLCLTALELTENAHEKPWPVSPIYVTTRTYGEGRRCLRGLLSQHVPRLRRTKVQSRWTNPSSLRTKAESRRTIRLFFVQEIPPGLAAAEETARIVLQAALAGDREMICVLAESGGGAHEAQCPNADKP